MRTSFLVVAALALACAVALPFVAGASDDGLVKVNDYFGNHRDAEEPRFRELMAEPAAASESEESGSGSSSEQSGESESEEEEEEKKAEMTKEKEREVEREHEEFVRNMHITSDDQEEHNKEKELAAALQAVKDQIVDKANHIKSEKKWSKEVNAIMESYSLKIHRVEKNISDLQKDVKVLFRKKKQVENMILQRKLEKKLQVASNDLLTLQGAMHTVQAKRDAFQKSESDIRSTIGAIEHELKKLRGRNDEPSEPEHELRSNLQMSAFESRKGV